jgi:hypothetical protein
MKREVGIFIETDSAQAELNYSRLELFNDEKISVSSTIQNISDISKIFTDFSQGFTIPCTPTNNAIFQHFYQNDVDATILYQNRYNAYIEIDTTFFRRGKIQLEKTNLKNGKPDSYSVTFYGAGVSLKDYFNEDKLSQLDYSSLDHEYTSKEVVDRITIDSSVTDYDVRYPLISSKRVWQFDTSNPLPDINLPEWYTYPSNNENNLGHNNGRMFYYELFPAVRVASIFELIEAEYGITFNGLFLGSEMFRKAFLWFKNKEQLSFTSSAVVLDLLTTTNSSVFFLGTNKVGLFLVPANIFVGATLSFNCSSITPNPNVFYIDVYKNNSLYSVFSGDTTGASNQFSIPMYQTDLVQLKVRSIGSVVIDIDLTLTLVANVGGQTNTSTATATSTATTNAFTNLASVAPDMKISDFVSGICKEFNMTAYSTQKNVFTFDPIPYWYYKGNIIDITQFTDVTSIEIERMKLYKSIEFKYQDSECFMNKYFLQSQANVDGHGYGNVKMGWDYDGGEYKIESPFENLLHNNFGNNLQVGYSLNKELTSYIPKPCLLYMNQLTTINGTPLYFEGVPHIPEYVPFGQDTNILSSIGGFFPVTLNFGAEISSFYNVVNINTLYEIYYASYLSNLYNKKNRLVKVKTILPVSLLTTLKLNDRLVIRDKRYMINEMQSDLTTGDVNFSLISDFSEVKPIQYIITPVGTGSSHKVAILFSNGATQVRISKSANAGNVTLSSVLFTSEGYLIIGVPPNVARVITITLDTYINGNTDTSYIIIDQQ